MTDKTVIKTAFLVLGIVIGAGFASGKEIITFFSGYGANAGFLVILMSLLIFYIIYIFIRVGKFIKPKSLSDITKVVFKKYAPILDAVILLSLFVSIFAMLAGADALASDVFVDYTFPYFSIILSVLVIIIVTGGLKSILSVNSIIVPVMIGLVVLVSVLFLLFGDVYTGVTIQEVSFIGTGTGMFSILLYVCMNMLAVSIIVAQMGALITKKNANKIAFMSSFLIAICVGLVLLVLLNSSSLVVEAQMPMIRVAYSLGEVFGGTYFSYFVWHFYNALSLQFCP
jgi:uncharacterized membrane protein YkvI